MIFFKNQRASDWHININRHYRWRQREYRYIFSKWRVWWQASVWYSSTSFFNKTPWDIKIVTEDKLVLFIFIQKDVQVFAHCAGSLVCFASLLSGALQGKVRSLVASQVAANPIPCPFNKMKAGLHIPEVMEALGFKGLTVYTDDQTTWGGWLFNNFVKGIGYTFLPYNELCRNPVCHRYVSSKSCRPLYFLS